MEVLVTGGAGFIGSNLCEELVAGGDKVTVIDNLHTGAMENLSPVSKSIRFIEDDVRNIPKHDGLGGLKQIYHLGIPSSSPMYKEDPMLLGKAIDGFVSVMELARKNKAKVVFASSSSVYNGLEPPHKEDMDIMVTDYYTEARLAMERLGKLYNILHGVPVIAMRFFSVYGPHEKAKGRFANTVSQFMWSMQDGQRPVIYGDGSQTRDYIFVKDVVAALKMAMKSDIGFDVLNVGTGTNTTTNDTIRLLNRVLGKSIEPEYVENPIKNYVHHTKSDCTKARERLGFTAKTTLEEGIRSVLS